jgi:hypothetical protein
MSRKDAKAQSGSGYIGAVEICFNRLHFALLRLCVTNNGV